MVSCVALSSHYGKSDISNYKLFCAHGTDPFTVLHNSLEFGIFANPDNEIKCDKDQATSSPYEGVPVKQGHQCMIYGVALQELLVMAQTEGLLF